MLKIDFKKEFGELYFPMPATVVALEVPQMAFAMVDRRGDPNTSTSYREALEALFGVSYTLKFGLKRQRVAEFKVGPLETLWSTDDADHFVPSSTKTSWRWTAMVMQPKVVSVERFRDAVAQLSERKGPHALPKVRFGRFREGWSAQTLHIGPYSAEGPTIERVHEFIRENGGRPNGRHHEIYLSDPRRTAPAKLRTVVRQPFQR